MKDKIVIGLQKRAIKIIDNDIKNLTVIKNGREKKGLDTKKIQDRIKQFEEIKKKFSKEMTITAFIVATTGYLKTIIALVGFILIMIGVKSGIEHRKVVTDAQKAMETSAEEYRGMANWAREKGQEVRSQGDIGRADFLSRQSNQNFHKSVQLGDKAKNLNADKDAVTKVSAMNALKILAAIIIITAVITLLSKLLLSIYAGKINKEMAKKTATKAAGKAIKQASSKLK